MRATSRLIRTVLVAAGLLAISASAAQAAMPIRQSNDATDSAAVAAANRTIVFHRTGFLLDNRLPILQAKDVSVMQPAADSPTNQALVSVMQPAADSPTDQTVPLVINQPVPAAFHASGFVRQLNVASAEPVSAHSTDNGFVWTDAAIGAFVASLVLILAAIAATIVRPRQTLQL